MVSIGAAKAVSTNCLRAMSDSKAVKRIFQNCDKISQNFTDFANDNKTNIRIYGLGKLIISYPIVQTFSTYVASGGY